MIGFFCAAIVFVIYLYVWSMPREKRTERRRIFDHRFHVRDRPEGGYFIFAEVGE
jgi:hypothetical protein